MAWQCFMLEETGQAHRLLRRYAFFADTGQCPASAVGYGHDASVAIEDGPFERDEHGIYRHGDWPHDDPRWPAACSCGYQFTDGDRWQLFIEPLYRRCDTEQLVTLARRDMQQPDAAPAGAMWYAAWAEVFGVGPDGKALIVRLPSGTDWTVDAAATSGGHWTRRGTPPLVTASPSIWDQRPNGYHGWLQNGVLTDDLEGRSYP